MITIGSLFSGIGGLELGLEWAGLGRVIWQAEADRFCRDVLAAHWPEARRYQHVEAITAATAERPDVLCGGFPCQDVSLAGKGAGLAGDRSGLWWEYLRVVDDLRPRVVVVENVPGLVRRGLDAVVGGLVLLGYSVEGTRISAADVGAPHLRERIFLVAVADTDRDRAPERGRGRGGRPDQAEPAGSGAGRVADTEDERRSVAGIVDRTQGQDEREVARGSDPRHWPTATRGDGRSSGSRNTADSAAHFGESLTDAARGDYGRGRAAPAWATPSASDSRGGWIGSAERGQHGNTRPLREQAAEGGVGVLNPEWVEALMGFPLGWTRGVGGPPPDRWPARRGEPQHAWEPPRLVPGGQAGSPDRRAALGNAVVPRVAQIVGWRVRERLQK